MMDSTTIDKQFLFPENPRLKKYQKAKMKRSFFMMTICFVSVFSFLLAGIWFTNYRMHNQSFNFYFFATGNDSELSKISLRNVIDFLSQKDKVTTSQEVTTESIDDGTPVCSSVSDLDKLDCYPDAPVTETQCRNRGCCYHAVNKEMSRFRLPYPPLGIPYCYYPSNYVGYKVNSIKETSNGLVAILQRVSPSGFPNDVSLLELTITGVTDNTVRIKITDHRKDRYEVPIILLKDRNSPKISLLYTIKLSVDGSLYILRKSSGVAVFSTNLNRLTYADQFLQLTTQLPTQYVYGLGENYQHLLKDMNWSRITLFNRDNFPQANTNLYGTHPMYLALENDFSSHGVFLLNSNPLDIVLQPKPAVTFRTIGGVLDFFVFLGPTSSDVISQYTQLVGQPFMPPYWSLGFHLCRYGSETLNRTKTVFKRMRDAKIPFDVQWSDIDYMERKNIFTYDKVNYKDLPQFVNSIHEIGMHYVVIVDPGLSNVEIPGTYPPYDDGVKYNVLVKNSSGGIFIGKVWNLGTTVFPDFTHPNASRYWTKLFSEFHDIIPIDGAWIDMNEPSNFYNGTINGCPKDSPFENPPYIPGGKEPLSTKTFCMTAKHFETIHYNEHNMFGFHEANLTNIALRKVRKKRPFIISRSSFAGQGVFGGHWSGDIASSWEDLRYSVIDLLNFNMFGMPMMGSDICGFRGDTTVELCARWSALGSFYPFSRNHNDMNQKDQDPVALGEPVISAARNTLNTRYMLLPYLYTLFHESHVRGITVARPLFFEFSEDIETYNIDEQFLWGPALMIIPALYPGMSEVTAYFPKSVWYDFYTGQKINASQQKLALKAPYDSINLALRGGHVLPQQHQNTTTVESRKNKFFLVAGLNETHEATGSLYWDDGDSLGSYEEGNYNLIEFYVSSVEFSSVPSHKGYNTADMELDFIKISGLPNVSQITSVYIEGIIAKFSVDNCGCLTVFIEDKVTLLDRFTVTWTF